MRRCLLGLAFLAAGVAQAQVKPVEVAGAAKTGGIARSSAIDAGDYVYVSGMGANDAGADFGKSAGQALENLKAVVEAAGLSMKNVVYVQVYLDDVKNYGALREAFKKYFPGAPPAGAVLGVAKIAPAGVQINAVAVRDLTGMKAVVPANYKLTSAFSPGMLTHDRLFVSAMQGRDMASGKIPEDPAAQVDLALDGIKAVAEAAGLTMKHFVFVNPFLTEKIPSKIMNEHYAQRFEFGNTPARATISATALPEEAQIEYTGVAVRDLSARRAVRPKNMPPSPTASPCVFAGETLYCSAKSGFIPGPNGGVYMETTAAQLRQTMRNQLDNLEEAGMDYSQVVSTTVYLDNLADTDAFSQVYSEYFKGPLPASTIVQQIVSGHREPDAKGHYPDVEQMSLIAIKRGEKKQ